MQITILGITGGVGDAVATAFLNRGWRVVALARDPARVAPRNNLTVVPGDASDAAALDRALEGSEVVFHGLNLPYPEWDPGMINLTDAVVAAAERASATILFPGNVYGLGPHFDTALGEDCSHEPTTAKGVLRNRMEATMAGSRSQSIVLRMGDFFGGIGESSWMNHLTAAPLTGGTLRYPADKAVLHNWCYLPDAAEVYVQLAERRDELAHHEVFHFEGHIVDGHTWLEAVQDAIGKRSVGAFPWMWMQLARPFMPMVRGLFEMRYIWDKPVRMRGDKLASFLPVVPHTPFAEAIRRTLVEAQRVAA